MKRTLQTIGWMVLFSGIAGVVGTIAAYYM
jgi:hypothetical protein